MKLTVKAAGVVLVFLCFTLYGFFKSFSKKDYIKWLKKIDLALIKTENLLRQGNLNREGILKAAFSKVEGFNIYLDSAEIKNKDISDDLLLLLNTFLSDFGRNDTETELSSAEKVRQAVLEGIASKQEEYSTTGKLWRTAGICAGLAVGIMLI